MTDQPLFSDTDDFERTYVGEAASEQPNVPPRMPNPALEHGMLTTPPLRADADGIASEPIDQGALGDNDVSAAARLEDPTNADAG